MMTKCLILFACFVALSMGIVGCEQSDVMLVGHAPAGPVPMRDGEPIPLDDTAKIARIDACASLSLSSLKTYNLQRIAQQWDLGPVAQTRLVDAAFDMPSFDHHKAEVLDSLIRNPVFCERAKSRIMARMVELPDERHRDRLLAAMECRGPARVFVVADLPQR